MTCINCNSEAVSDDESECSDCQGIQLYVCDIWSAPLHTEKVACYVMDLKTSLEKAGIEAQRGNLSTLYKAPNVNPPKEFDNRI